MPDRLTAFRALNCPNVHASLVASASWVSARRSLALFIFTLSIIIG